MKIMELNPKKIYKICHSDIQIGSAYSNFKALTNCIIFLPTGVIEHHSNYQGEIIPTRFLITFDLNVILGHFTSYDNGSVFQTLTENDYNLIVEVFKTRGKLKELSILLKDTNYRYNRKLDKIIDYENK